jgi:hypothetical protein
MPQFLFGDNGTWSLEQHGEDVEGLTLQVNSMPGLEQFGSLEVNLVQPKLNPLC